MMIHKSSFHINKTILEILNAEPDTKIILEGYIEDIDEEIGKDFGEDILKLYGDIDIRKAKEYQNIVEEYYPIKTIIYGIKNNRNDFIEKGREILNERC